jgi:hypothetical protein
VDNPFKSLPPKQKKALVLVGVGAVGYVTWKWLTRDKSTVNAAPTVTSGTDEDPAGTGIIGSNVGGSENVGNSGNTSTDEIDTSRKWYDAAVDKLANAGWNAQAVQSALGEFLTGQPLDADEARMVRAAVGAMGGYPPGGPTTVKETAGPTDVSKLPAPTGLKAVAKSSSVVELSWNAVPGAKQYKVYRSGVVQSVGGTRGTTVTQVGGLDPGASYTFYVAAGLDGDKMGPRSSGASVKVGAKHLTAPTTVKATLIGKSSAHISWAPTYPGKYVVRRSGSAETWESIDTQFSALGLKSKTRYSYQVAAVDPASHKPGPWSSYVTFTTKR